MVTETGSRQYYVRLERILQSIGLRIKLFIALEFFLQLASLFLIILLGSLGTRWLEDKLPYLPFAYFFLALILLIIFLLIGIRKTTSRLTVQKTAGIVEAKLPGCKDDLTNALLLFREIQGPQPYGNISDSLVTAHIQQASDRAAAIDPRDVVTFRKVMPQVKLLIPLVLTFLVVLLLDNTFLRQSLASLIHPFSTLPLRETSIAMEPVPALFLRGNPFTVKAKVEGYIPERLTLTMWPEKGDPAVFSMAPAGSGVFTHPLASVQTSFRYQASGNGARSSLNTLTVVDPPDIGRIRLTLIPPAYTGLSGEMVEGGNIEALRGTVAGFDVRATKAITEGSLIINGRTKIALKVDGDILSGNMVVFYPGVYSLSVRDKLGFENAAPVPYKIRLIPDKYPEGTILSPAGDMEVAGNEVLPIAYRASDDFGLTELSLLYERNGTERSIPLQNPKAGRSLGPAQFAWDLGPLALTPGDRVFYRLSVTDNDAVSGPKIAYSRALGLHVRDEKDLASRETTQVQEIYDALLELLADNLENTKSRKVLADRLADLTEKVARHMEQTGKEKTERYDLESLQRNMAALNRNMEELPAEKVTQELERLALLAEDTVKQAGMHEVEAISSEIRTRQRLLMDALRDQKAPIAPESLQGMLQELEKLKDLTRQVMDALSRLATRLPDEFINNPNLKALDFADIFKNIDEIQKMLRAGDLASARDAAQRMLDNLMGMLSSLANAGAQANKGAFDRMQSEMSHQASELDTILSEQRDIHKRTGTVAEKLRSLMDEETDKRIAEQAARLRELLERITSQLPSEQRDSIAEMKRLLNQRQIEALRESARGLEEDLTGKPEARKLLTELLQTLHDLVPDARSIMPENNREEFPGLSSRQKSVQERTGALGEKLDMLSQLFPGLDTDIINRIKDAAQAMDRAYGKLQGEDAGGALPPEEEAIRNLSKSQQSMQQAAQQMAARMQANRWGYPLAYDQAGGWNYAPWQPLPTLPQPKVKQPKEEGFTGMGKEEYSPPSREAYKPPQNLREKVTESLKETIPPQYRREVERYFRGLTE